LENIDWNADKKRRVAEVLVPETMSSEESSYESDGEGRQKVTHYKVKTLTWEGERLKRAKKALDKIYRKKLSQRARDRILPREKSDALSLSTRTMPDNFPEWACNM